MALKFNVNIVGAENAGEVIHHAMGFGRAAFLAQLQAGPRCLQSDQMRPAASLFEFVPEDGPFFFSLRAQLPCV